LAYKHLAIPAKRFLQYMMWILEMKFLRLTLICVLIGATFSSKGPNPIELNEESNADIFSGEWMVML